MNLVFPGAGHLITTHRAGVGIGSISAALSCQVFPPRVRGRSAGSFPEQRLVIEPRVGNLIADLDFMFMSHADST